MGVGYLIDILGEEINVKMCQEDLHLTINIFKSLSLLHAKQYPVYHGDSYLYNVRVTHDKKIVFWVDFEHSFCQGETSINRNNDLLKLLSSIIGVNSDFFSDLLNTLVQDYINCNDKKNLEEAMKLIAQEVFFLINK
jgi:hypothetical protein